MAWNNCVVTNQGRALLNKALAGQRITITRAIGGTGVCAGTLLNSMTTLVQDRQTLSITGIQANKETTTITIQVVSKHLTRSYLLNQVGVFARLDGENTEVLCFILQDEQGIHIPSQIESSNFILTITAVLILTGNASIRVIVDPNAYLTTDQFYREMEAVVRVSSFDFVISPSMWDIFATLGGDISAYPMFADIENPAIDMTCFPYVILTEKGMSVAQACELCTSVDTPKTGILRFYAKDIPESDISGTCHLFKQGKMNSDGYVDLPSLQEFLEQFQIMKENVLDDTDLFQRVATLERQMMDYTTLSQRVSTLEGQTTDYTAISQRVGTLEEQTADITLTIEGDALRIVSGSD